MQNISKFYLGVLLLLTVSMVGCGGGGSSGGGGSTVVHNYTGFDQIEPGETYELEGISKVTTPDESVDFSLDSSIRFTTDSDFDLTEISVQTPTTSVSFSTADGDEIFQYPGEDYIIALTEDDSSGFIFALSEEFGWEYQTFGIWDKLDSSENPEYLGAISAGAPTVASAIPTSGQGTYIGESIGTYWGQGHDGTLTRSDLEVLASFGNQELAFRTSGTHDFFEGDAMGELDMSGTLTYEPGVNHFSGSVSTVSNLSGRAEGMFYGPNAEELGGVFATYDDDGYYGGSFGARDIDR